MTLSSNFALKRGGGRNNEGGVTTREYGTCVHVLKREDYGTVSILKSTFGLVSNLHTCMYSVGLECFFGGSHESSEENR